MTRSSKPSSGPNRRRILVTAAALTGAGLTADAIWGLAKAQAQAPTSSARIIDYVCDQVIPTTETPGALSAGVPVFVELAVAHGLAGSKGDELSLLQIELDKRSGGDFMALSLASRAAVLAKYDEAAFSHAAPGQTVWPRVKLLILMGYYTSEIGGAQELRYELTPGQFQPDLPYHTGDRALSNDWAGVEL